MGPEDLPVAEATTLQFDDFEIDLCSGELRRGDVKVRLQEKPFLLLAALLERPGQLVTREELQQRLWPDQVYLELDDSLNTAALKLRQALRDSASRPRFIETVPRRGYRFIGTVQQSDPQRGDLDAPPSPRQRTPQRTAGAPERMARGRILMLGVAAIALLSFVLTALRLLWREEGETRIRSTMPLTTAPGLESRPSWAPDGTRVVYESDQLGQMDIWVQQVGAGLPVSLTHEHRGYDGQPAWSPGGEWIAFASDRDGGGIFVMTALGGNPRRVLPLEIVPSVEIVGSVPTIAWSPDGRQLAYGFGIEDAAGLFVVAVEGGTPQRVPLPPEIGRFSIVEPAWSGDGERLAFTVLTGTGSTVSRIWMVRLDGSDLEPLTEGEHHDHQPFWSDDGSRVFFVSDRAGAADIWWVHLDSSGRPQGEARPLTAGVGISSFALSPDGRYIAYSRLFERSNVWRLPVTADLPLALADARPLSSENHLTEFLSVTSDCQSVAFDSSRSGNMDIWMMRDDGSGLLQITRHPAQDWHPSLSPDGRRVAFHSVRDGNRELYVVPVGGGAPTRLTHHPAKDWIPSWSPTGEQIVFGSGRSGNQDVWIVSSAGGDARQLTFYSGNDHNPTWSPDGGRVIFSSDRSGFDELYSVAPDGGDPTQLTDHRWLDIIAYAWSADGETAYLWGRQGKRSAEASFWALRGGIVQPLFEVPVAGKRISAALASCSDQLYFPLWERVGDLWLAEIEPGD